MVRRIFGCCVFLLVSFAWLNGCDGSPTSERHVAQITVDGTIGPATTDHVANALANAEQRGAEGAIILLNSPRGLESAGREIAEYILSAPFPVITYVAPENAHAGMAGAWVLYASHIAAMSPSSSLQIPNPLPPGDEVAALAATLAAHHQRNTTWAAAPSAESSRLTAQQALADGVIDIIASNMQMVLTQAQGSDVQLGRGAATFTAGNLPVMPYARGMRNYLLSLITHPMAAYLFLLAGLYGLLIEAYKPGALVPGILGAVALLVAFYSFQVLPVNAAGLALVLLAALLLASEALIAGFGLIALTGLLALVIGSYVLMDADPLAAMVSPQLTALLGGASGVIVVGLLIARGWLPVPYLKDRFGMTGRIAYVAHSDDPTRPQVRVDGRLWQARSAAPLSTGQRVRIAEQRGRVLTVEPAPQKGA